MAESATPHAPRPKKRVTRTQARNRRIIALLLLALFVFLIRKGCVACVHSHNDKKNNTAAVTTTTTEETTTVPEPASILPETTAPEPTPTIPQTTATDPPTSEYLISGDLPTTYSMEVDPILQLPELPTGCEITTLAMLLDAVGFQVDKVQLAEGYLTCKSEGEATFQQAFIGSPYDSAGYGCYAPVIVDTARKYLAAQNSGRIVKDLTGAKFEDLLREVASNHPVAIWASIDLVDIQEVYAYTIYNYTETNSDGSTSTPKDLDVYWLENEHVYLLKGYDLDRNVVIVNDSLNGEMEYDMDWFKECYEQCYKQAVIIY